MLKVGSIVFATKTGLGILAKSFYDNGIIEEVLIEKHNEFKSNKEWYPNANVIGPRKSVIDNVGGFPYYFRAQDTEKVEKFLDKIDVLLLFEVPFYYELLDGAKKRNIKVILMPMYEVTPYPIIADYYVCPSLLDLKFYKKMYPNTPSSFIPIPVDMPWKQRTHAKTFIHNAGNGGTADRNGTMDILASMQYVKSPIDLVIRCQKSATKLIKKIEEFISLNNDDRISIQTETLKYEDLFLEGDVFLFPERFNGLSLPLQEAYASGMAVMCGKRFPMTSWLPNELMVPVEKYETVSIVNVPFKQAKYDIKQIANIIDEWYGKDIKEYSLSGKAWAEKNSWEQIKPQYMEIINNV